MRASSISITIVAIAATLAGSCKKGETPSSTPVEEGGAASMMTGCDHDVKSNAIARHSWPYPADYRNLRWGDRYQKMRLKLKPNHAAFVTATVTWKDGALIEVEDSEVHIKKPRRLPAKRDLFVKRKVWDQGIQVERTFLAARAGEVGSFFFYNSRGMCMVGTEAGPGWTPCTLDDAFEGLSEEHPGACEEIWWAKVRKSRVDRGWMQVDLRFTERVPPPSDAAK